MRLVIHAPNVHVGGGAALLTALLKSLDIDFEGYLILDKRMELPRNLPGSAQVQRVRPTILGRLLGEWRLRGWAGSKSVVLCFGNLPPLFRLRSKVFVFLQNRHQIEKRGLKRFPMTTRLRIRVERQWFRWAKGNVSKFIVQTPSMHDLLQRGFGLSAMIMSFTENPEDYKRFADPVRTPIKTKYDFLYVSSGEPHKNHRTLIKAWILLAKEGIRPGLCLTVDRKLFSDLSAWIEVQRKCFDLKITNLGVLPRQDIERLYKEVKALIFPSDLESLGLPLIEARCKELPILASEKDYVRDVIDPEQTFDPDSPLSIARAVKRFLGKPEEPLKLVDAGTFLTNLSIGMS